MKKIYNTHYTLAFGIVITALSLSLPLQTFAQTASTASQRNQINTSRNAQYQQQRISDLKSRADTEITRRTNALQGIASRLQTIQRLSQSDKQSLATQVQSQITTLQNLQQKIVSDTDLATVRTDVSSIVSSYRIFAVLLPKIQLLSHADKLTTAITLYTQFLSKLQFRIQNAQTKNTGVASLSAQIAAIQSQITDATTQISNANSALSSITPDGYPGNKTQLMNIKSMLHTAYTDLTSARQGIAVILHGLHDLPVHKSSSASTAATVVSHLPQSSQSK